MKKIYTNLVLILAFIAIGFTSNAQDFVINPGGEVTVLDGSTLYCDSKIIINTPENSGATGSLMIKSDAIVNPVTADGGVVYKRFLSLAEWHMITSPVVGMPVTSAMSGNTNNIYLYDNTAGAWARTSETMVENRGYLVYSNYYTINYASVLFSSKPVSITGGYSATEAYKSWNFAGNKNTCSIDLDIVLAESTEISATIYTMHDGAYGTYSTLGGGDNGGSRYVLPTQGFMFLTTDGANSLEISHNAKVHKTDASEVFSKKNSKSTSNLLKLSVSGNDKTNTMKLLFSDLDGVTENYDPAYDALKSFAFDNKIPECYLVTPKNENIAVDFLPESKMDNYYSAMGFRVMTAGEYTINISEFSFDPSFPVILEDTYTGDRISLGLGTTYKFNSEAGEFSGRFNLYFNPVEIPTDIDFVDGNSINVYANKKNLYINLNTSDINNARVEIYNLVGSKVIERELHSNQTVLDLDLMTGDYIVKVISGTDTKVSKVFVN